MNLELPFSEPATPELDEHLARIDRELDALFLDDVEGTIERLRAEHAPPDAAVG